MVLSHAATVCTKIAAPSALSPIVPAVVRCVLLPSTIVCGRWIGQRNLYALNSGDQRNIPEKDVAVFAVMLSVVSASSWALAAHDLFAHPVERIGPACNPQRAGSDLGFVCYLVVLGVALLTADACAVHIARLAQSTSRQLRRLRILLSLVCYLPALMHILLLTALRSTLPVSEQICHCMAAMLWAAGSLGGFAMLHHSEGATPARRRQNQRISNGASDDDATTALRGGNSAHETLWLWRARSLRSATRRFCSAPVRAWLRRRRG